MKLHKFIFGLFSFFILKYDFLVLFIVINSNNKKNKIKI